MSISGEVQDCLILYNSLSLSPLSSYLTRSMGESLPGDSVLLSVSWSEMGLSLPPVSRR